MLTDSDTAADGPSAYGLRSLVLPPASGRSRRPRVETPDDRNEARQFHHRTARNTADPVVQISPSESVIRRSLTWPGMSVEIVKGNRLGRIDCHFCGPFHMLAVYERGVRQEGRTFIDGLPASTLSDCSRKLAFVPAGHEYHDWQEPRTLPHMAFFYFSPTWLASTPELGLSRVSFAPRLFFEDGALWDTTLKLKTLIETGGSDHRLYIEALGVVHELLRINAGRRCASVQVHGGLAAWQRRKASDYIQEHLAEPILLAALAQLVRLSPNHCCRAFMQSFGMPPQRYHTSQRIERAKTLLATRDASVTDVGLTVGYSEASSFSTAFRRVTGLSPSAYRRGFV
jgi:AraC family transcriptional regulator